MGLLMFLLYIDELPLWITNEMRMFAVDTKVWCRMKETGDGKSLQKDLDSLNDWSDKWLIRFNPDKCKIVHVGHELDTHYFMKGLAATIVLVAISEEKDLGVFVRSDLKVNSHCIKYIAKARRIIGMGWSGEVSLD